MGAHFGTVPAPDGDKSSSKKPSCIIPVYSRENDTRIDLESEDLPRGSALELFIEGLLNETFKSRIGIANQRLIEYLVNLVCRDALRSDDIAGRSLFGNEQTSGLRSQFLAAHATSEEPLRSERFKHIGDVSLVLLGLYPEQIVRAEGIIRVGPIGADYDVVLKPYFLIGRSAFLHVSQCPVKPLAALGGLMRGLTQEFEPIVHGLRIVSQELRSAA